MVKFLGGGVPPLPCRGPYVAENFNHALASSVAADVELADYSTNF